MRAACHRVITKEAGGSGCGISYENGIHCGEHIQGQETDDRGVQQLLNWGWMGLKK